MDDPALLAASAARSATDLRVTMVYLARLREAFGCGGETLVLPGGTAPTVAAVLDRLRARGGAFARELAPGRAFRVAVNHAMAPSDAKVQAGDEVAILPPVTGG
jgi:molybdopterin synthase sulfur carrier subunit